MGCYSIDWTFTGSCHGYIQRWGEDNNSSNNTVSLRNVFPVDVLLFFWLMFHCHFMTKGSDGSKIKHTHSNNTVSLRNVPLPVGVLLFFRLIFHCRFMTIASDGGKQQQQRQSDERTPCCSVHWCFTGRAMTIATMGKTTKTTPTLVWGTFSLEAGCYSVDWCSGVVLCAEALRLIKRFRLVHLSRWNVTACFSTAASCGWKGVTDRQRNRDRQTDRQRQSHRQREQESGRQRDKQ